eukprot:g2863.t1
MISKKKVETELLCICWCVRPITKRMQKVKHMFLPFLAASHFTYVMPDPCGPDDFPCSKVQKVCTKE